MRNISGKRRVLAGLITFALAGGVAAQAVVIDYRTNARRDSGDVRGMEQPSAARANGLALGQPDKLPKAKVQHLIGAMHEHSAYSDGWPGTRPADYYASGKNFGLDFLGGSEHSDNADIPLTLSDGCLDPVRVVLCPGPEGGAHKPADSLRKWDATLEQAREATTPDFTGIRGFEWTSDRYGHINVYYSKNDANAKTDGGYAASMETFWKWFTDGPELGGGSDGLATFNHPGDKEIVEDALRAAGQSQSDPSKDWEDFRFVPEADDRMVGIEMYNTNREYGDEGPPEGYYVRALDRGWHVGAIGAEDLHGVPGDDGDWGAPRWAKTIILAPDRSEASLRAAMLARRFYAVAGNYNDSQVVGNYNDLRLDFRVDGNLMGSRLERSNGSKLKLSASVTSADPTIDRSGLQVEVVTSGIDPVTGRNRIVASGNGSIDVSLKARHSDPYYFIRVQDALGNYVAYSSPVWVAIGATAAPDPTACDQTPDPARWVDAGTPDAGLDHMRITVHRGAANLAPEDTIPAFEYAIAYGLDMIEVDVQQTLDGRYVVLHDYQVDKKTNGSGFIQAMTYDEATALNAADNDTWRASEYNPTYVPGLEKVLALARQHGVGISFDLKESVWNTAGVALLAAQYPGVIERSIFQPYFPGRTEQILAVAPEATVMFNSQYEDTPPAALYALGAEYDWFGSSLPNFPPEAIAAIHDACDFVQPNVYQGDITGSEAGDLAYARSIGADGAMVNNPDVAADVLDRPVATTIEIKGSSACLVGHHGLGLPGKTLDVDGAPARTARGGCVPLPPDWNAVNFGGDGSALPSSA